VPSFFIYTEKYSRMKKLTLIMFGALKDHFEPRMQVEVDAEWTGNQLFHYLKSEKPAAADVLKVCQLAINNEFISTESVLPAGAQIVMLPPFSGG